MAEIRRRIPDVAGNRVGATLTGENRLAAGAPGKRVSDSAPGRNPATGDRPTTSDLRKRIPDLSSRQPDSADVRQRTAAAGPKGDRGGKSDTGRPDVRKTDSGKPDVRRTDSDRRDPGKSDVRKPDSAKTSSDRPSITELRKRIPDASAGKTKLPDGRGKVDHDRTTTHSVNPMDRTKAGDLGGKTGRRGPPDLKSETKGAGHGTKINPPDGPGKGKGHGAPDALANARFPDRVKKGEFDALAKGAAGQKIKLADQYRLAQQGDVARRLGLHGPGGNVTHVHNVTKVTNVTHVNHAVHSHPGFGYRGWISPYYHRHAFEYRCHFGPAWYPRIWWYPRWSPWVHWSWYHRCRPYWDPRPLWCRPVAYVVVARPWVYWDCPVWTPLPVVSSGTWVEVDRPVVPEAQYDLQVLAVRFVDPGHPDEKLGPRYRVWFRNNSAQAITQGFDVRLFATPDATLTQNAVQAGVRVTAIEAGDTQSVDIRLPFDVAQAPADAQGKAPFQYLHAIVDAAREIRDVDQANNGAAVPAADVLPVDPAAFEADPATLTAGGELIVAGEGLGPEPGRVLVHLGTLELEAEVLGWYDLGVRVKMPDLPLAEATKADVVVVRGDGAAANPLTVTLHPPLRDAQAPAMNAPALPPVPAPPQPAPNP